MKVYVVYFKSAVNAVIKVDSVFSNSESASIRMKDLSQKSNNIYSVGCFDTKESKDGKYYVITECDLTSKEHCYVDIVYPDKKTAERYLEKKKFVHPDYIYSLAGYKIRHQSKKQRLKNNW